VARNPGSLLWRSRASCSCVACRFPPPPGDDPWRYRLLGAIVPDLDAILATRTSFPVSPKHPIPPLNIRPALLAGVAIVDRASPATMKMPQRHMSGENKTRFVMATEHPASPACEWVPPQQMQLFSNQGAKMLSPKCQNSAKQSRSYI
jgi:hypothetical protein